VSEKNGSAAGGKPDVAALRAEIKQTRAELGETVQALAAKADVKARAKEQVEQTKAKVKAQVAGATGKATEAVRTVAAGARGGATQAGDRAHEAGAQVRRNPVPLAVVLAGMVVVVGVILIVRGRRR
jgi:cobalamin biosynthesis Mg chelatase CobN